MSNDFTYPGKDLEAMSFAERYHTWIYELMSPFIGRRIVEVGAGCGNFSKLLLRSRPDSLTMIEPSSLGADILSNVSPLAGDTRITVHKRIFSDVAPELPDEPDTMVYVNVLEHIEDDARELEIVRDKLVPGGHVCIFVPAGQYLFSEHDKAIGHFRRYGRQELVSLLRSAGLKPIFVRFFDLPGVFAWFLNFKLTGTKHVNSDAVRYYDGLVVPVIKRLEALVHPPFGKNLLVIGKKDQVSV